MVPTCGWQAWGTGRADCTPCAPKPPARNSLGAGRGLRGAESLQGTRHLLLRASVPLPFSSLPSPLDPLAGRRRNPGRKAARAQASCYHYHKHKMFCKILILHPFFATFGLLLDEATSARAASEAHSSVTTTAAQSTASLANSPPGLSLNPARMHKYSDNIKSDHHSIRRKGQAERSALVPGPPFLPTSRAPGAPGTPRWRGNAWTRSFV